MILFAARTRLLCRVLPCILELVRTLCPGNFSVYFRKFACSAVRCVLSHQTEKYLSFVECFGYIFQYAFCIFPLRRKHEMTYKYTFFQKSVTSHFIRAGLPIHLLYGGSRFIEIIRRTTVLSCSFFVRVFQIRKPYLNLLSQNATALRLS